MLEACSSKETLRYVASLSRKETLRYVASVFPEKRRFASMFCLAVSPTDIVWNFRGEYREDAIRQI